MLIGLALLAGASSAVGALRMTPSRYQAPGPSAHHLAAHAVGRISLVSAACAGPTDDVTQASDSAGDVYVVWEGCRDGDGIGLAHSRNGGGSFEPARQLKESRGGWDPQVALAPDGTVYVSFMNTMAGRELPVLEISHDRGRTFSHVTRLIPPAPHNWGDEDYLALAPDGTVYLTWDYGPSAASVHEQCSSFGSCWATAGDLNAVIQSSTDGGLRFGPIKPVSPGFPASGADAAPLTILPNGTIDVLYQGYAITNKRTLKLGPGHSYFTASTDGGSTWSPPHAVDPEAGSMAVDAWWNNGAISQDAAGDLYATWDTETPSRDRGWMAYSTDAGKTWSQAIQAPTDHANVPHIMESAGGPAGIAYVGWMSDSTHRGYAMHLRTFEIGAGWLSPPTRVSRQFGTVAAGTGDTFGISTTTSPTDLAVSWGSAIPPRTRDQAVFGAPVAVVLR